MTRSYKDCDGIGLGKQKSSNLKEKEMLCDSGPEEFISTYG